MKKFLYIAIAVLPVALFLCCGCERNATVRYQTTDIVVNGKIQDWSTEDIEHFLKMINDASWEYDATKTMYDYTFELSDGTKLYYTSHLGLINDKENQRHVVISDAEWLNNILGISDEAAS